MLETIDVIGFRAVSEPSELFFFGSEGFIKAH